MILSMRHISKIFLVSALCVPVACNKQVIGPVVPDSKKSVLEMSAGINDSYEHEMTKAITNEPDVSLMGELPAGTALFMVMKSENENDDSGVKYTVTKAVTGTADNKLSPVSYPGGNYVRYWDDTYARSSMVSIYAACSPGSSKTITISGRSDYEHTGSPSSLAWRADVLDCRIADWKVSASQNAESLRDEDLCYSNNVSVQADANAADKRLKFNSESKKFDKAKLCMRHAMSKLSFNIIRGEGFSDEEFKFDEGTNIKLSNFYTSNTVFDLPTGEFTGVYGTYVINTIALRDTPAAGCAFSLDALVMPTTDLDDGTKGDISLIIAGNKYDISKRELLNKISEDDKNSHMISGSKLKPGVHYTFTFRIGKAKIDEIVASVVDWEEVNAGELTPSNARIKLKLEERGEHLADDQKMAFYRALDKAPEISDSYVGYNWNKGYSGNKNIFSKHGIWELENAWYWENNMSYYHFRGVMPENLEVSTINNGTDDEKDCFAMQSALNYTDCLWGAPMRDTDDNETPESFKFKYTADAGFDNNISGTEDKQLYQAIGPTEDAVKLTLFHMMSEVEFRFTTSNGSDKVEIGSSGSGKSTKVVLEDFRSQGRVLMGNGKVETVGVKDNMTLSETITTESNSCKAGIVPQDLSGVSLRITTPDHNEYIVNLKDISVGTEPVTTNIENPYGQNAAGKWTIDSWYPGFKYVYSFKLTKKGITDIVATIVAWESISADDDVQIQ